MRTLEEIIETMTLTCDVNSQYREQNADVLHYLKSYQDALKQMEENQQIIEDAVRQRDAHIKALAELNRNEPLTWDELKTMEGKPVWVEINGYNGYWTIVHMNSNIVFEEYYDWIASPEDPMKAPLVSLDDTNFGTTWQAYRKERNEDR